MIVLNRIAALGKKVADQIAGFGVFARFCGATCWWLIFGTKRWCRLRLLLPQLFHIGTASTPVVMVVGAFIGMVLAVETYPPFVAIGQESRLGGVIGISVVKQIGPVLAAVMLAGRVGGSVAAELGTMRVTEQLDALRAMGVDPIAHLVVPRVFACVTMIPLLTVFSDLLGIFGSWGITVGIYGVTSEQYWSFAQRFIVPYDVFVGLIKSVVFGLSIGLISCFKGFYCQSGAAGVGRATTNAFVTSFIAIIVANLFLAKLLNDVYNLIIAPGGPSAFSG